MIPTNLDPSSALHIRGYRDLGTFTLPVTNNDTAAAELRFFSSLVDDVSYEGEPSSEIMARLSTARHRTSTHAGPSVQVFAFPVQSGTADGLVSDRTQKPVWKWSKPNSYYYSKTGFWEVEIDRAVEDGEWRAGRELQLLVRGVSTEKLEALKNPGHRVKSLRSLD